MRRHSIVACSCSFPILLVLCLCDVSVRATPAELSPLRPLLRSLAVALFRTGILRVCVVQDRMFDKIPVALMYLFFFLLPAGLGLYAQASDGNLIYHPLTWSRPPLSCTWTECCFAEDRTQLRQCTPSECTAPLC